jgi:hypothetical protein
LYVAKFDDIRTFTIEKMEEEEMIKIKNGRLILNVSDEQKRIIILANLILGFIVAVLLTRKLFSDPDGFWHIRTGQWILENNKIPRSDTFSWYGTEHKLTWLNHEWLFAILISLVYKVGGLNLVMWSVALFAGILYLLINWYLYIRNKNIFFSLIISSISLLGLQPYLQPRPQVLSYCLLLLVCILLEKKKWYFIIPIMILEANLHGGFWPLFIVVITFYAYKEKPILILLSIVSVLINPYGFEMYLFTFKSQFNSVVSAHILEAMKTRMAYSQNVIVLITYIILIAAIHNIKIKCEEGSLAFAVGGLTFMAQRHVAFAYLLIMPVLSPYLLMRTNNILESFAERRKFIMYKNFIYLYTVEVIMIFLVIFGIRNLYSIQSDNLVPKATFPSETAIKYIKDNRLNRIFNEYGIGGYLIFNNIPDLIDGRADPFSEEFNDTKIFREYCEVIDFERNYIEFLQDNNIKFLLLSLKGRLSTVVSANPRFEVMYKDDYFAVYKLKE